MKSLLTLPHIKVENANAISGLIYGFPAVTHFLGYVHAISRALEQDPRIGVKLGGCGIISHSHQIHAYQENYGEHHFSLTRNPLTKGGKTAPFNEEGKMRMEVSLVIECDFTSDDFDFGNGDKSGNSQQFTELVLRLAEQKRLARGYITSISPVKFHRIPEDPKEAALFFRRILLKMIPAFVLCDRSDVFKQYLLENSHLISFEGILDFYTLKIKSNSLEEGNKWQKDSNPANGSF
jgi:CRISPR-associated protein Csy2